MGDMAINPKITISRTFERSSETSGKIEVVVVLPTFRRPEHLVRTLESLKAQRTDRAFAVVVMENDDEAREGSKQALRWFESNPDVAGIALLAHERGNCSAYNAGIATALERYQNFSHLLVIDDDEIATEHWMERLVAACARLDVDIVGAPQIPVFESEAGRRWSNHPVFVPHYRATGAVPILYSSGNVAIRRAVLEAMAPRWLDPGFNFIGGGDADFYTRCKTRGFTFGWCNEAPVMETMPTRRTESSWINARSLRNGAISSIIERRNARGPGDAVKRQVRNLALLAASPLRSAKLAIETRSAAIGLYHVQVAVGRFMAEFGRVAEQYREPEKN